MATIFDIVVPVFAIVGIGFSLRRVGVFGAATSDALTRFVFFVAVPAMLFRTLAQTQLPESVPWLYILAFYGPSLLLFVFGVLVARHRFGWSKRDQGIAALSASYSNMVMLGLPLILAAYGDAGALPLFILLALQSTLMFSVTTWTIEVYGIGEEATNAGYASPLFKLLRNPIILSLALGLVANLMSIDIVGVPARLLQSLGAAAPACALVALGAGLAQYEVKGDLREATALIVLKNLVHPILVALACWSLEIDRVWTEVAILLAAMPVGINAFVFAQNYDTRVGVVSKAVVLSTLFSMISVVLLLRFFEA